MKKLLIVAALCVSATQAFAIPNCEISGHTFPGNSFACGFAAGCPGTATATEIEENVFALRCVANGQAATTNGSGRIIRERDPRRGGDLKLDY